MPIRIAIALRPVVGFVLHHLRRGDTRAAALDRLRATTKFGKLSEESMLAAVNQARENLVALARLAGPRTGRTFVDAFKGTVEKSEIVGMRIFMTGVTADGKAIEFSITMNAPAQTKPEDALAFAKDFVESGGLQARTGRSYPVKITHVEISAVQPYGFRKPTLQF